MGAGKPDFQRLAEMGKLPAGQLKNMPHLVALDERQKELNRLREGMCEACHNKLYPKQATVHDRTQIKCDIPGCPAMVGGRDEATARINLEAHKKNAHRTPVQLPASMMA